MNIEKHVENETFRFALFEIFALKDMHYRLLFPKFTKSRVLQLQGLHLKKLILLQINKNTSPAYFKYDRTMHHLWRTKHQGMSHSLLN